MFKNLKGVAFGNDGAMVRMAITYDEINNDGTISKANIRINKIVTDKSAIEAMNVLNTFATEAIEG